MTYLEVNDTVRVEYRGAVALKCRVQAFDDKTVTLVTMEGAEVVYGHHDGVIDAKHDVARVGVLDRAEYAEYVPDKRVTITFTRHALVKGVVRANDGGLLTIQPDNYPNPIYLDLAHLPPEVTSVLLTDMVNLEVEEHTLYEKLINDLPKHKRTPEALATVRLTVKRFAELMELSPPPMAPLRWIMPKVKVEGPPVVETFEGVVFDVTRVHTNKLKVGTYMQRFVEGDRAEVASYIQCPKLVPFSTVSLPATPLYRRANLNQQFLTFFKAANYLYRTTPPGPINLAPKFTEAFTVFDVIAALEPYRMYTLPVASLKKVRALIDAAVRLHLERMPRLDSKKNSRVVGTLTDHPGSASEQLAHMMRRDYGFGSLGAPRRSAQWVKYQEYRNTTMDRTMVALAKSAAPSPVPTKVLELLATYAALKGSALAFIEQHARASKPEESEDWLYFVDDDITEHKFVPVFVTTILRQKGSLHDVYTSLLASKKAVILDNLIVDVHSGYSMPYLEEVATNEASPVPPDVVVPKISGGDLPQLSILKKLSHYLSIDTEPHYADIVSSARGKDHVFAVAARLVELGQPLSAVAKAVVAVSKTRRSWQKDLTLAQVQFRISEHLRPTPVLAPPKEVEWASFLPLSTIPELRLKPIDGLHEYELIRGKLAKFGAELTRQVREGSPTQAVLQYIEQLERHHPPIATLYQFGTKRRITIKEHPAAEYPVIQVEPTTMAKDPSILERLKTCLDPTGDIADLVPKCPPLVLYNFIVFAALTVPNLIKHKYRNFKEGATLTKVDKVARCLCPRQSTELLNGMNSRLFPTEGDYTEQDAFVAKCNVQRKHLQEIVARASDEGALKYCLMQVFDTFITDPEGGLLDDPEYAHAVVHACVERLKSEVDNFGNHRSPV